MKHPLHLHLRRRAADRRLLLLHHRHYQHQLVVMHLQRRRLHRHLCPVLVHRRRRRLLPVLALRHLLAVVLHLLLVLVPLPHRPATLPQLQPPEADLLVSSARSRWVGH